jgi:ribosomal protein L11 methyltransferase
LKVNEFLELSFALGELDPEAAEAACFAAGASAVTFADAGDDAVLEPLPGEVRLWRNTILTGLFAQPGDALELARSLGHALNIPPERIGTRHLQDRAWEREWLRDFHAMRFGERLWVCPHHERVSDPRAVVVHLDPGLAFGTGTHASTALCLSWLDAHLLHASRVIDFGCGSGVLAVAAALLGAAEVHAFDLDPQALTATAENAAANGVASRVHVHALAGTLPVMTDVLLANILAGTLCSLAAQFAQAVTAGGTVVLAGILEHQVPDVTAAYTPWFDVSRFGARDGWAALSGRRR